jgi:uncharacterized protein (TIGR03000 family)
VPVYAPQDENVVRINVRVPASAQVWFDGAKTTQTGSLRQFVSPPLDSDRECSYQIRAHWTEGGRDVERTRKVNFHAGDQVTVNFMARRSQDGDQDLRRSPTTAPEYEPAAQATEKSTHDGKVVSIAEDTLVMTGKDEKEHKHALTADVKMICDGKVCKYEDIRAGMKIRVTSKKDDNHTVTRIEALDKNDRFEQRNQ